MGYEIYEQLCRERGLKPHTAARLAGVSSATVSSWKKGDYSPKADKRQKLAEFLGVTLEYLDTGIAESSEPDESKGWIPVIGRVQAGIPIEAIEDILDYEQIDPALISTGNYFALKIRGNSMAPRICEDDVVIVRQQATVENGDLAVVLVNGEDATVKKVVFNNKGMTLVAFNPEFDSMAFCAEEVVNLPVKIIGKVVELRGKF